MKNKIMPQSTIPTLFKPRGLPFIRHSLYQLIMYNAYPNFAQRERKCRGNINIWGMHTILSVKSSVVYLRRHDLVLMDWGL